MTAPEYCPACLDIRVGIQEGVATYRCGSTLRQLPSGGTSFYQACLPAQTNPIAEEMTRRIAEPQVDILLEVKRDAWRRGAEAMRNEIAITLGKFQNADDMTVVADDVRNIQTPRYFDV